MILVALGANLPSERFGSPRRTLEAALDAFAERGVRVLARSRWYSTAPYPPSDQPRYVNAVAKIETALTPEALLDRLHDIEREFGRQRGERNAARTIDLDLIDYDGRVSDARPTLPHPRMHERAFVLRPLGDIAPEWRHPATGESVAQLLAKAPDRDAIEPMREPAS